MDKLARGDMLPKKARQGRGLSTFSECIINQFASRTQRHDIGVMTDR